MVAAGYHGDLPLEGHWTIINIFFFVVTPVSSSDWTLNPSIISDKRSPSLSDPQRLSSVMRGHILPRQCETTHRVDGLGLWYALEKSQIFHGATKRLVTKHHSPSKWCGRGRRGPDWRFGGRRVPSLGASLHSGRFKIQSK